MGATHQQGSGISQTGRADEALARTVRLLESSLESQQGTILFSIDTDYRYLYFNTAHAGAMRAAYAAEPRVGMNILELISSTEDRVTAKENYDRALAGESHSNVRVFGDVEKAYYESFFNPILDDDGAVIGATGMARDISERMQVEGALREREQEFRTLAEAMPQIVWITRPDGWNTYFNQQWVDYTGMTLEESYGEGWSIPFHPNDRQHSQEAWAAATATGGTYEVEVRLRRSDGAYRWWLIRGVPLLDSDGEVLKWFGTCTDIDDLKQAEVQVEHMKRLYATLSQVNQTIVHVKDASALWQSMCDVAVEFGEFTLAWVGLHDKESGEVRPVAANGIDLAQWPFAAVNTSRGDFKDGLLASALLTGAVVVTEDIETDELMRSVLGQAHVGDYHSIAAIPFKLRGETTGVLVLVAADPGSFKSVQEVKLLEEMGLDISFALDTIATEEERERSERELRESHDMIINLTDQVPGVVYQYRLYPDGSSAFPFSSSGMEDIYEYSPEAVREDATPVFGRIHADDYDRVAADISESADTLEPFHCEFRVVLPRQGLRWRMSDAIPQRMEDGGTMWYGIISDTTERVMAEQLLARGQEQLVAQAARLKVIADVSQAFAEVVDSSALLDRVASKVSEVVGGSCWVRLLSDDEEWLDIAVLRDTDPQTQADAYAILSQQHQPVGDSGVASEVFLSGEPALIPIITADQLREISPQRLWPLFERFAMHSVVVAALRVHGKSIGVMGVTRSRAEQPAFTGEDLSLVQDLANRVAMAISNAQLVEHQERHLQTIAGSLSSMIEVVSRVIEARDPYTVGHERRVSELAVRIASELGMRSEQVEDIRIAALVHDVGKVSVPTEILSKPNKLTAIEFLLIKGHSETGFEILSSANMEHEIAEMVHQHHERCDGSGYPRGLRADELLDGAKVLAVADVVEAMVSHRPYRAGLGVDIALAEIERGSGLQYDARVSEACVRLFREGEFEFTAA